MRQTLAPALLIFAVALAFRAPRLADRPMHADEAVLADKFGTLLETGSYQYDPREFHGPLLGLLTLVPARVSGAHRYQDLTEATLRAVPVLCGPAIGYVPGPPIVTLVIASCNWLAKMLTLQPPFALSPPSPISTP